jgi:DinB superfamily
MDRYLEQARAILDEAVSGMSEEQLAASRNGKWSPAQIFEHLSLAFGATAAGMERTAAAEKLNVRAPSMRDRVATLLVIRFGYIPTGRKAPDYTVPSGASPAEAIRQLHDNLAAMDAAITRAEQRWGDQRIAVNPAIGPLNPDQWREFHFLHARHHARQIVAIKAASQQTTSRAAA